jgi:GR25 family glycosyltransferase involved in LPS biosynthesis
MIPVFVISTPGDEVRKANYEKQFEEQWIFDYKVVKAIMYPKQPCTGIARSHKAAVTIAKENNYSEVMIVEDDIEYLKPNSHKRFIDIYAGLPPNVNILVGCLYDGTPVPVTDKVAKIEGKVSGLICYIIRQNYYDKFLEADEIYNIDYWISNPDMGNAVIWGAYPMICLQKDGLFSYNTLQKVEYNEYHGSRYKLWNGQD